jgi:glycosyltransferase involved in cell wall biosynthesis
MFAPTGLRLFPKMTGPLVTLGVPVFRGGDALPAILECLRTQSYQNLDVLISVDGADEASAEAARPFLKDSRFRLHVQPTRLGWAGNTDWTMRHRRGEFYIYQQHDDVVSPTYVADLVEAATKWPHASICYSEMEVSGIQTLKIRDKSLLGEPLARALTYLERLDSSMFRGLMRGSVLDATAGLLINEYDSYGSDFRLMTELALAGEFRFVQGPTYFKRVQAQGVQMKFQRWPNERKRAAWACLGAWMVEVIVPAAPSLEERWRLFYLVLDRFLVARGWLRFMRGRADWFNFSGSGQRSGPVRAVVNRARGSGKLDVWLRKQRRGMFCQVNNRDVEARAELLRDILGRLGNGRNFDVSKNLQSTWEAVEAAAIRHFALSKARPRTEPRPEAL